MELLAGHLFGDILLQNRWLARVKMQSVLGMVLHCLLYTFGIWVFSGWNIYRLAMVFVTHFIVDFFGLGKVVYPNLVRMGNPKNENEPVPMWLSLLCDQSFHIIILWMIEHSIL